MTQFGIAMFNDWIEDISLNELVKNIREHGAEFVEFKISAKNWKKKKAQVEEVIQNRLDVTVHAPFEGRYNPFYFENSYEDETFNLYKELLQHLDTIASLKKSKLLVNIHAASADSFQTNFNFLMKKSIKFFNWFLIEIQKNKLNIEVVVELLPFDSNKIKVGITSDELVSLSKNVKGNLDFCWDIGHFHTNQMNNLNDSLCKEFLSKVKHIHLHDIFNKEDHMPLKFDTVPFIKYLSHLNSYCPKKVALELNYQNTKLVGMPYSLLYSSLEKAQALLTDIFSRCEIK